MVDYELWERLFGQEDLMSRSTWMCESDEPRRNPRQGLLGTCGSGFSRDVRTQPATIDLATMIAGSGAWDLFFCK